MFVVNCGPILVVFLYKYNIINKLLVKVGGVEHQSDKINMFHVSLWHQFKNFFKNKKLIGVTSAAPDYYDMKCVCVYVRTNIISNTRLFLRFLAKRTEKMTMISFSSEENE